MGKDVKKKLLVTTNNFNYKEETYDYTITCPKCGQWQYIHGTNFCRGCGIGLVMSQEIRNVIHEKPELPYCGHSVITD